MHCAGIFVKMEGILNPLKKGDLHGVAERSG